MLEIRHVDGGVERDRNHLHEGVLPLFARELLGAVDVIGDREQAERTLAGAGGVGLSLLQVKESLEPVGQMELPESEWVTTESGKVLRSLGKINAHYALKTFGANAQPYYVLQGRDGRMLVEPRGYDLDVEAFVDFLRRGVEAYRAEEQGR